MKITVVHNGVPVFMRQMPESKTLNNVVNFLLAQPAGTEFETTIENNGHSHVMRNVSFDVSELIRIVEGIIVRKKKSEAA